MHKRHISVSLGNNVHLLKKGFYVQLSSFEKVQNNMVWSNYE